MVQARNAMDNVLLERQAKPILIYPLLMLTIQMLMAVDNYGGASWCQHGVKAFCCPATGAQAAVSACRTADDRKCPSDLPQQIGTIGSDDRGWLSYCCPADPVWYVTSSIIITL